MDLAAGGHRVERAGLEGGGGARIAFAIGGLQPHHAADGFAAVDGALWAAQDFEATDVIGACPSQQIAQWGGRITQAHAIDHDL